MGKTALDLLQEMAKGRTELNAPMSDFTTMRVGGPADILIYPEDREDLANIVAFTSGRSIPRFILGKGSNLIVRDAGIRGVVINLSEGLRDLEIREATPRAQIAYVGGGMDIRRFTRWTVDKGFGGFERLAGIPGTIGGAVVMNAGAWDFSMGDRVLEAEIMDSSGQVKVFRREMLNFTYRRLDISPDSVIVGALLEGTSSDGERVKATVKNYQRQRSDSQPVAQPSAGSIFKNPAGHSAGKLIEECGLKGIRVGDAMVSATHANFIVNIGEATAGQVVALMGMIQERVYMKYKVKLEPEVKIVGEWEKGKLRIQE